MHKRVQDNASDQRARARRLLHLIWLIPLLVVAWWGVGRLTAPMRAVRVYGEPPQQQPQSPGNQAGTLRVAAYNIAHGWGLAESNWAAEGRVQRLGDIAALLKEIDADIVVLNEVDFDARWSGRVNQARLIAQTAGYPYRLEQRSFDLDLPLFTLKFGNAVLSRHPIVRAEPLDLPAHKPWEAVVAGSKQACVCDVRLPGGRTVRVVPIHLEHRAEETRIDSVRPLLEAVQRSAHPRILLGDFNSTLSNLPGAKPGATGMTALDDLLTHGLKTHTPAPPPPPETMTFRADRPTRIIDWILVGDGLTLRGYRVIDSTLSDHRPVVADIDFAEPIGDTRSPSP